MRREDDLLRLPCLLSRFLFAATIFGNAFFVAAIWAALLGFLLAAFISASASIAVNCLSNFSALRTILWAMSIPWHGIGHASIKTGWETGFNGSPGRWQRDHSHYRILARCKVFRADFHAAARASKQAGELIGTIPVVQGGDSKAPSFPLGAIVMLGPS